MSPFDLKNLKCEIHGIYELIGSEIKNVIFHGDSFFGNHRLIFDRPPNSEVMFIYHDINLSEGSGEKNYSEIEVIEYTGDGILFQTPMWTLDSMWYKFQLLYDESIVEIDDLIKKIKLLEVELI